MSRAHEATNGVLLRRDIPSLFDAGYVTVTPDYRFEVGLRIREDYENGRDHYAPRGWRIMVPERPELRRAKMALERHNQKCFRGHGKRPNRQPAILDCERG